MPTKEQPMKEIEVPAFKVIGVGNILIIKGAPTPVEMLRGRPFVNDDLVTLTREVLEPLGLVEKGDWDEGSHPRNDDGKFGGGSSSPKDKGKGKKSPKEFATEHLASETLRRGSPGLRVLTSDDSHVHLMADSKAIAESTARKATEAGHAAKVTTRGLRNDKFGVLIGQAPGPSPTGVGNDEERTMNEHERSKEMQFKKSAGVMFAWCDSERGGEEQLLKFIGSVNPDVVISVDEAVQFEKSRNTWNLPLLQDMVMKSDEMSRKIIAINKRIDNIGVDAVQSIQLVQKGDTPSDQTTILTPIHKANQDKQIVYGVVLDPYQVDTQNDWIPPSEIEKTAHDFMKRSRTIGLHHAGMAEDAFLVESSIEVYPTESDRQKASNNEPHRVFARKYGEDKVHSGAWIIGVQLSDRLWKMYKDGEIGAFSIEGFGARIPTISDEMPVVTFTEIGEVNSANGRIDSKA